MATAVLPDDGLVAPGERTAQLEQLGQSVAVQVTGEHERVLQVEDSGHVEARGRHGTVYLA